MWPEALRETGFLLVRHDLASCVFNLLPLFLVQAPFNIPGAGNIAGAAMYLGLFILFLI